MQCVGNESVSFHISLLVERMSILYFFSFTFFNKIGARPQLITLIITYDVQQDVRATLSLECLYQTTCPTLVVFPLPPPSSGWVAVLSLIGK